MFINRLIQSRIESILERGKSILLLGPRQTGKTTLLEHQINASIELSFIKSDVRRRYESNPEFLIGEIQAFKKLNPDIKQPIVIIDEVQKVPIIMDTIQDAIDSKLATFVITGSSARKLTRDNHNKEVNLLPGRVIELRMDALSIMEMKNEIDISDLVLNGSLPEVMQQDSAEHKEDLLTSYVGIYLEEEIRAEALVRNLASFSRFLALAAIEAGNEVNINNISEEINVSRYTITEYFQILQDCLIVERIEPITNLTSRRRLTKSPKYLFFDMGIRRIAAGEGLRLPQKYYGELFEQFIGIEILKVIRLYTPQAKLKYWHDHAGPEVDYIVEINRQFLPIEVKWTETPSRKDARHIFKFLKEYECILPAYVVCRTPNPVQLDESIIAINWRMLPELIRKALQSQ
jgi:predicted AAA+ superfamily ATPase